MKTSQAMYQIVIDFPLNFVAAFNIWKTNHIKYELCQGCYKKVPIIVIIFVFRYPFSADQEIVEPDWEVFLRATANFIVQEQSPKK